MSTINLNKADRCFLALLPALLLALWFAFGKVKPMLTHQRAVERELAAHDEVAVIQARIIALQQQLKDASKTSAAKSEQTNSPEAKAMSLSERLARVHALFAANGLETLSVRTLPSENASQVREYSLKASFPELEATLKALSDLPYLLVEQVRLVDGLQGKGEALFVLRLTIR